MLEYFKIITQILKSNASYKFKIDNEISNVAIRNSEQPNHSAENKVIQLGKFYPVTIDIVDVKTEPYFILKY